MCGRKTGTVDFAYKVPLMNNDSRKKLVATNAAVLALAAFASFTLPKIAESITDGPANFLVAMAQVVPILVAIPVSCSLIGKSQPGAAT
tara:strand:+ start:3112 stop:3378 length:267 start_codon:yes stop_codon:yes gene_type:complete